jgi:butyryl-CoA dehydrogenase
MPKEYASLKNLNYLLFDVHKVEELVQNEHFKEFDSESIKMMIDSARKIGDTHMFPYLEEIDR